MEWMRNQIKSILTMQQKTISTLLLLIGFCSSLSACKKIVDEAQYHHHQFVNNSGKGITITKYQQGSSRVFDLADDNTLSQWIELNGGGQSDDVLIVFGDSAKIEFDDGRFALYSVFETSRFNFLLESNFVLQSVDKKEHRNYYVYTFTVEDYNASNH
jgi:hypothetical protein